MQRFGLRWQILSTTALCLALCAAPAMVSAQTANDAPGIEINLDALDHLRAERASRESVVSRTPLPTLRPAEPALAPAQPLNAQPAQPSSVKGQWVVGLPGIPVDVEEAKQKPKPKVKKPAQHAKPTPKAPEKTAAATAAPTAAPTPAPTPAPTVKATEAPTPAPTAAPTAPPTKPPAPVTTTPPPPPPLPPFPNQQTKPAVPETPAPLPPLPPLPQMGSPSTGALPPLPGTPDAAKPVELHRDQPPVEVPVPPPPSPPAPSAAVQPPVPPVSSPAPTKPPETLSAQPHASDTLALSIPFQSTETTVPLSVQDQLKQFADRLKTNDSARARIVAYASDTSNQGMTARRVSLSRALAIRAYLIDQGVNNLRLNVQAEGNKASNGNADRVDVYFSGKAAK